MQLCYVPMVQACSHTHTVQARQELTWPFLGGGGGAGAGSATEMLGSEAWWVGTESGPRRKHWHGNMKR